MQSLSVSNLHFFEVDDSGYTSGAENVKNSSNAKIKGKSYDNNRNKFNLKINLSKLLSKNHQKYDVSLTDSGYLSGSTSAETIFSIDNNNYVSFKLNSDQRRDLYSSSKSLYDKSPIDSSEIFGLNLKILSILKENQNKNQNNGKNFKPSSLPSNKQQNNCKDIQKSSQTLKYENRSWDQILALSDAALDVWLSSKKNLNKYPLNLALNPRKTFEFLEPSIEVKNSLLLNKNLLYQPIRRYTSEINLRRLVVNQEMYSDDFQLDSHMIAETDPRRGSISHSMNESTKESEAQHSYTEAIYELFMDLHEFRINDDNIERVADNICKIDKYLMSRVRSSDLAGYLFNKTVCGCGLSSLCSVIQFSQALNKIVINCIDSKIAAYQRIAYIIAFIKLSMSLYRQSNWQSLNTMVSALHSFKIYRMNTEWIQIKRNHKHYFDEFLKLSSIVRSSETSLMYTIPKGIQSLNTLLLAERMHCLSKWDRLEAPPKWTQPPGIIDWLERELKYSLKSILHLRDNKRNEEIDDCLSGCLSKQFICLIPMNKMPENWSKRSLKNIPQQYKSKILDHLAHNVKTELKFNL